MKDEVRIELPNGSMVVRIKVFLGEADRVNIRKMFRLLHRSPYPGEQEEAICRWLSEKAESHEDPRKRKRYQGILTDAGKIFGKGRV